MRKLLFSAVVLVTVLSGCFVYDCGYTRNDDLVTYKAGESDKMPISYSLDFSTCFPYDSLGTPTEKSIKWKIDKALKDTGLFSEVTYGDKNSDGYHLSITYRDGGFDQNESMGRVLVYVYTLFMFPIPENYGADLQATLYLKGKPIWAVAHTEKARYIVCWYALPAGIVMNYWSVWRAIEFNLVNATLNDLTQEHIRRFIPEAEIYVNDPNVR